MALSRAPLRLFRFFIDRFFCLLESQLLKVKLDFSSMMCLSHNSKSSNNDVGLRFLMDLHNLMCLIPLIKAERTIPEEYSLV